MSDNKKHIKAADAMARRVTVAIGTRGVCFAVQRINKVVHESRFTDATGKEWFGMECWTV